MNEKAYLLSSIRADLETLLGPFCPPTWRKMKAAAGVPAYASDCDGQQWLKLCAYAAIRRNNATIRITPFMLAAFIRRHGDDPTAFLPGFVSTNRQAALPELAGGYELQRIIKATYNLHIPFSSLDRYCRALFGGGLRVNATYSNVQIEAVVRRRAELLAKQRARLAEAGQRLVEFNQGRFTQAS